MEKPRAALWLWYRGDRFAGFQAGGGGPGERTVGASLQDALRRAGARDVVMAAGRTDRGVHARMQVVSVRTSPEVAQTLAFAPGDESDAMGVALAVRHAPSFHALWSAKGRTYRYRLSLRDEEVCAEWAPFTWLPARECEPLRGLPLSADAFCEALRLLPGTRTFRAFHAASSVEKPRTLHLAEVVRARDDGLMELEFAGDAFGRHQVRELVGACVAVAAGRATVDQLAASLENAVPFPSLRAPAKGLVLWEVDYPLALDPFGQESLRREAEARLPDAPPFRAL